MKGYMVGIWVDESPDESMWWQLSPVTMTPLARGRGRQKSRVGALRDLSQASTRSQQKDKSRVKMGLLFGGDGRKFRHEAEQEGRSW